MYKATIRNLICLLLIALSFTACKKDALQVNEEKRYEQVNAQPATDPMFGTAVTLILRPNGQGYINPGGDIVWPATYKISGKKITVTMEESQRKYRFDIISDEELHGTDGEILKLSKD